MCSKQSGLTSLQKNGIYLNATSYTNLSKVTAVHSNSNEDHIIIIMDLNYSLYYSIFDCKSYQWVNFSQDTNYIDKFLVANKENMKNFQYQELNLIHHASSALIKFEDYLIITGAGRDCNEIVILDIRDETAPRFIHKSAMVNKFENHGCVKVPNTIDYKTGKNFNCMNGSMLLFGGRGPLFLNSIYELSIQFKTLAPFSSQIKNYNKYPIIARHGNDYLKSIKDVYTDPNGKNIEIQIKYKRVPWKCKENDVVMFSKIWQNFRYAWQHRWSDCISNIPQIKRDEFDGDDKISGDSLAAQHCPYLLVFGGDCHRWGESTSYPSDIAVLDVQNLEWHLCKYKLQSVTKQTTFNALIGDNGLFMYVVNCTQIYKIELYSKMRLFIDRITNINCNGNSLQLLEHSKMLFKLGRLDESIQAAFCALNTNKKDNGISMPYSAFVAASTTNDYVFKQMTKMYIEHIFHKKILLLRKWYL